MPFWLTLLLAAAAVALVLAGLGAWGGRRWTAETRRLRARLEGARIEGGECAAFDPAVLGSLPPPVGRYLGKVLTPGQPLVRAATLRHRGKFNTAENGERWQQFASDQRVIVHRPGFDWDARLRLLPALDVRAHDAYVAGEGLLRVALLGAVPLVRLEGTGAIAEGELTRYLAEAAWYPTALLPGEGAEWKGIDERTARCRLVDGAVEAELEFRFGADGLIEAVTSEARPRHVGDRSVPTPWEGRYWRYERQDGMQVPVEGEVAWCLPERRLPYWRGRIESIRYEYA